MKKNMLIFWLCLLCTATYAQTEFAPNNAHWHYGIINSDGADFLSYTHCAVKMDTLIEGHVCSKVTSKQYNGAPSATVLADEYLYTSGDTVFYFNRFFRRFLILYRFDVAKGDTLKLHVPFPVSASPDSFRVVVDSVYPIRIGSLSLRHVRTHPLDHFTLDAYTERVGGTSLIGHRQVATTGFILYNRCYGDGEIDTNFTHKECDYLAVNSIAESLMAGDHLLVYPNPAEDEIYVAATTTTQSVYIYDVMGKCCFSSNAPQMPLRVTVRQWPAGIYRICVTNDKGQARICTFERQ